LGKDQRKRNLENVSQYGHRHYLHQYCKILNINKCQSTDFDAHIAWITLSFISYMMLSLRKRFDDYEIIGEVFRAFKNELLEITLVEKLW
jgi:hypothetical protein